MPNELSMPIGKITWADFQQQLTEYVRLELTNQDADTMYPQIALLVETSPECKEAYYLEYRRQVLAVPASELGNLGRRPKHLDIQLDPGSNIYRKAVDGITLLLERGTDICRGLQFELPTFSLGLDHALAPSGMMSDAKAGSEGQSRKIPIRVPEGAPVELMIEVKESQDPALCILEAAVELEGRFGDYSGVTIILEWADQVREAVTDEVGLVRFDDLPQADLPRMRVRVNLPDDEENMA